VLNTGANQSIARNDTISHSTRSPNLAALFRLSLGLRPLLPLGSGLPSLAGDRVADAAADDDVVAAAAALGLRTCEQIFASWSRLSTLD